MLRARRLLASTSTLDWYGIPTAAAAASNTSTLDWYGIPTAAAAASNTSTLDWYGIPAANRRSRSDCRKEHACAIKSDQLFNKSVLSLIPRPALDMLLSAGACCTAATVLDRYLVPAWRSAANLPHPHATAAVI